MFQQHNMAGVQVTGDLSVLFEELVRSMALRSGYSSYDAGVVLKSLMASHDSSKSGCRVSVTIPHLQHVVTGIVNSYYNSAGGHICRYVDGSCSVQATCALSR